MTRNLDKIISASRRTDIPAFYMDWFLAQIKLGFFNVKNPYTKAIKKVDVAKELIHSIVFWSKNYDEFIKTNAGERLEKLGFNFYFNFTINADSSRLEPNIPPLSKRLAQLKTLVQRFGPEKISWRFDPVCFYEIPGKNKRENNLSDFSLIARAVEESGISRCVTSFLDPYAKIKKRVDFLFKHEPFFFMDPGLDKKIRVIHQMEQVLAKTGIKLYLCSEKEVFSRLHANTRVLENSCIDGKLLKSLFGRNPEMKRDYGQRSKKGCKCTKSIDIGAYDSQPCFHNCLFCYANPDIDNVIKKSLKFNEN